MPKSLTQERLREVLRYERGSGRFYWTQTLGSRATIGDQAGSLRTNGYWAICIDYEDYYEHHLAWFWCYGEWPPRLDHADGSKWNNRIENLRIATQSQNIANSKLSGANKSGHKGVSWSKVAKKWHARIGVDGENLHLGYFTKLSDAAQAYRDAALKHFGEFARHNHTGVNP